MIRYRLPHEDLPGLYICKWCGATAEAVEDGRKPRYCAKNKRFKNGRPSFAVWSMSKYRVVEELVDEGLYGDFGEIASKLGAMILDDLGGPETIEQREQAMKWLEETMLTGSCAARVSADGRLTVITKDIWSVEMQPPQEMPISAHPLDPANWSLPPQDEAWLKLYGTPPSDDETAEYGFAPPPLSEASLEAALEQIANLKALTVMPKYIVMCPEPGCDGYMRKADVGYECASCGKKSTNIEKIKMQHENGDGV